MTKVYRVELLIVDHDGIGAAGIQEVIEATHYPNRCISPDVMRFDEREIEWSDDHPLNSIHTMREAFEALFASKESP